MSELSSLYTAAMAFERSDARDYAEGLSHIREQGASYTFADGVAFEAARRAPVDEAVANEVIKALEFYADSANWDRVEGHTKWASNLTTQDCAMLNCGGGRARLALAALREKLEKL